MHEATGTNWKRTFFTIWGGQKLSWIGSGVAGFALIWWLTDLSGSATVLAIGSLLTMLPGILLGPLIGALVDRWHRRTVMLAADTAIALASAWLAYLFWIDALQIWHAYLIMVARALGSTFHDPAIHATTALLVPKDHLSRIQGLNSALAGVVGIISPLLGAMLVQALPLHGIMAIDVVSALFAIGPLLVLDIPQPHRAESSPLLKPSVWDDVREGLQTVWASRGLRMILFLPPLLKLTLIPAISLVPVLVTQHFGRDTLGLGWMNAMFGLGMMAGGLTLSAWGGFRRRILTSMMGLAGAGVGTLVIGLSPATAFGLGLAGMLLTGVMLALTDGPLMALIQAIIPEDQQARVFTVIMSGANLATPLGMAIGGPVADRFGVHVLYILSGIACLATAAAGLMTPAVMHLEAAPEGASHEGAASADDAHGRQLGAAEG
jgi:DHA3 family macrolide efflux protein-like MFS transporter